jgi:uncharacterized protein DUF955
MAKTSVGDSTAGVARFVSPHRRAGEPLEAMALRLGVSRIVEESLSFEGGIFELSGGELVIKLKGDSPSTRKRFTLAHEIGHLLLGKPGLRSSCGREQILERKCDAIASELLMPADEVIPFIKSLGKPSPEKLKAFASHFEVSLQAAAFRVHRDIGLWKCFIGCWQRHPNIKTEWFVGYRHRWDRVEADDYSLDLALASETPVQSKELWQRGLHADPVWLNMLRIGNGRVLGLIGFVS